jgi:hypothetical protein
MMFEGLRISRSQLSMEQLDLLYGPPPGRQAKPVVLVEDNGPIHTSKRLLAALAARARWLTSGTQRHRDLHPRGPFDNAIHNAVVDLAAAIRWPNRCFR